MINALNHSFFVRLRVCFRGAFFRFAAAISLALAFSAAAAEQTGGRDLTDLSLEELMDVRVSLATRKPGRLSEIAAAVDVVTAEDMRRTGAENVPDALRQVPGMEVGRLDASKWALSSRGFNGLYSNKVLVLLDGMSLYSPVFSGVLWESMDIAPEEVSRIEVVRGPGATLWGAGAMNGVISIATREARETQGLSVRAGAGTEQKAVMSGRWGGAIGQNAFYRVYGRAIRHDGFINSAGEPAGDDWDRKTSGFRLDWKASRKNSLILQGEASDADIGQEGNPTLVPGIPIEGPDYRIRTQAGYVSGRWRSVFSPKSDFDLRVSFNGTRRKDPFFFGGHSRTLDVDAQHHVRTAGRHDIVWGAGFRQTFHRIQPERIMTMEPASRTFRTFSAFIQDDIDLVPQKLRLTAGSKFEDNSLTGFEFQPNLRLAWMPSSRHTFWTAVSQAVRLPDPSDFDLKILYDIPPVRFRMNGNTALQPEELTAFECGWKTTPSVRFHAEASGFINRYDCLQNYSLGDIRLIQDPPALEIPFTLDNVMTGTVKGLECAMDAGLRRNLRIRASAAVLSVRQRWSDEVIRKAEEIGRMLGLDRAFVKEWVGNENGKSPEWTGSLRLSWNPAASVDADLMARFVDELPQMAVPGYTGLDARLAWRPNGFCEVFVLGRNLAGRKHLEFDETPSSFGATRVERSVYGGLNVRMR
ncbi:TonB-dependent receptor [bacterium]|nr:TonB-dependent receptor [bacterium]